MTFNPLTERGMPVERQLRDWSRLHSAPYDKLVDPEGAIATLEGMTP